MLRTIEAGAPAGWRFAERWRQRMRGWARACERLIVPPGASAEVARLLAVPRGAIVELPSGVELDLFRRRPLERKQRLAHWRRWLVEQPLGWDESGMPGSVAYHGRRSVAVPGGGGDPALRRPLHGGQAAAAADQGARAGARAARPAAAARARRRQPRRVGGRAPAHRRPRTSATGRSSWPAGDPTSELPEALNAADLLVLPSVAEAFGLVLVEAMACGLPVIAADAHGPAEIVAAGTGWLVPADDQHALAEALLAAASDPQERTTARQTAPTSTARSDYGWPLIATRIVDIYDQLASRSLQAPVRWRSSRPGRTGCRIG